MLTCGRQAIEKKQCVGNAITHQRRRWKHVKTRQYETTKLELLAVFVCYIAEHKNCNNSSKSLRALSK